jgi:hypothetical protein
MRRNRLIFNLIYSTLVLPSLCSCNNDVFIDEMNASTTEIQMNGSGDSTTVNMNKNDWNVVSVVFTDRPKVDNLFYGRLYDCDDNQIYNYDIPLSQISVPWTKMVCSRRYSGFTISHPENTSLKIAVDENLSDSDFKFTILVGDHFKVIPIKVTQSPSAGYVFDHITYTYIPHSYWTNTAWFKDSISYTGNAIMKMRYRVYANIHQEFAFSSNEKKAFSYLKDSTRIDVPLSLKDSLTTLSATDRYYREGVQYGDMPFSDLEKEITIPIGKSEILRLIDYEHFNVKYTLYVRNLKTNEVKCINGIYHTDTPIKDGYSIFVNHILQR